VPAPRAYRFDHFRLDLAKQRLCGAGGSPLPVSGRAYDVLLYLVENRDRVVTKDELLKAVWPRTFVEENNLNQAVSSLRRALGDSREAPRLILTVAGRGYRFIGDAQPEIAGAAVRATEPAVPPKSVAVLPFLPLVGASGDQALELGMADTLINRLSALPGVAVSPLSSVRRFAGIEVSPISAGEELNVSSIVEGHIQVRDGRVHVNARLLQVADGTAAWSGSFDERIGDFFAVQNALAGQLASALAVHLTDDARRQLSRRHTNDVEAWQLYINGQYQFSQRNPDGLRRAIEFYEAAEARDPQFALPVAGLADAWAVLGVFLVLPPGEVFPRARTAAERAIALDPQLGEAHAALGHVLVQFDRDWQGGEQLYRRALSLKPTYAQATMWHANNCLFQGRQAEALREGQHAQSLEPTSFAFAANVGMIRYFLRDYDTAIAQLASVVEAAPAAELPRRHLARIHIARRNGEAALQLIEHLPDVGPGWFGDRGRAYATLGRVDEARAELAKMDALARKGFGVSYEAALVHVALGDKDATLAALERALRDSSQLIGFLNSEPAFDPVRDEPRFRAVSKALNLG
jgi:DNA-binding winged helix-turn-helix (wHTH) protein/Flp pilus assembly protein TadD